MLRRSGATVMISPAQRHRRRDHDTTMSRRPLIDQSLKSGPNRAITDVDGPNRRAGIHPTDAPTTAEPVLAPSKRPASRCASPHGRNHCPARCRRSDPTPRFRRRHVRRTAVRHRQLRRHHEASAAKSLGDRDTERCGREERSAIGRTVTPRATARSATMPSSGIAHRRRGHAPSRSRAGDERGCAGSEMAFRRGCRTRIGTASVRSSRSGDRSLWVLGLTGQR